MPRRDSFLRSKGREDTRRRGVLVVDGLKEVAALEAQGNLEGALARLQTVVALDPSNHQAVRLQDRLLEARARAEQARARSESLETMLAQADSDFGAGRFEKALSMANRVLALDAGNSTALGLLARAYREISQRLLGTGAGGNIPPAIRFADFREEAEDGSLIQLVAHADFRLSGVIIDDSPVEITFYDRENREVQGASSSQPLGDYYINRVHLGRAAAIGSLDLQTGSDRRGEPEVEQRVHSRLPAVLLPRVVVLLGPERVFWLVWVGSSLRTTRTKTRATPQAPLQPLRGGSAGTRREVILRSNEVDRSDLANDPQQ